MDDNIFIKRIFSGKTITFPNSRKNKKFNFNFLENFIIVLFIINQIFYVTTTPLAEQHHHHHHSNNNNRNDLVKLKNNNSGLRNLGRRIIIKQEDGGCYHNGTNFAENSYVPTMEPCLICKCANRTLICALRVCPEQPIPPPRGCVLVHGKRSCCPHISCSKMNNYYHTNNHFHEPTDHHKRHVETQDHFKRSDDIDIDPFEQTTLGICLQNGTVYQSGSAMSSSSLCSYCYCIDGRQKCVKPKCMLKQNGCTPIFMKGSCCPVRYDCLNKNVNLDKSTKKESDNLIRGIIKFKGTRSPRVGGCFVNSKNYPEGQKLPVDELKPCDICFCIRGERKCAPKMCAPSIQRCSPIVKKGECCASGYDCSKSISYIKPKIEIANKNAPRQFDFFSILFGLDEPQNSTTLSSIAYPEDRTPPEGSMIEYDGNNEPESDEEIEESDEKEEELIEEATNFEVEVTSSTTTIPISTTTEKNFFDIIREGLDIIDNNGDKIGMIIDEKTTSKLKPNQLVVSTTKKPQKDNNQSLLDLLLGPDDDDEYEEWKQRNKNTTNVENVTNYPAFSPQPSINYFPPLTYSEHDEYDRIKNIPRPSMTVLPPGMPFMNQGRLPSIPPVKVMSTQKTTTLINTQSPTTSTTMKPTTAITTTTIIYTTTTTPKPTTTSKPTTTTAKPTTAPTTTTTKPTTTSRRTSTTPATTTTKAVTTKIPTTLTTTQNTRHTTTATPITMTRPSTTTTSTTTTKPSSTRPTTTSVSTSRSTVIPTTTATMRITKDTTVKPQKTQNQSFSIDVNTSFKLNGPTNHSKPMKHTQYIQHNDTLLIIHEDIPPLVLTPAKIPGVTKVISPVGDSDDYSYNDFNGRPTLPPSLPNLKIIPFLPTDAVQNDRKPPPVITQYNTETENYDTLIDKRIDYEIDNPFGINFGLNNMYHNIGGVSNAGDGVLDNDPTNPQSLLKFDELGAYGEYTERPYEYRFSPPTKTEGGFRPRDPDRDDTYFYDSGYHNTANLTNESPNVTTSNPFNDVIKTEAAPNLLSLIEDKAKLWPKNYTDISLYDDTDDDIISITTDVNYNSNDTNQIESNENGGFFGNVLSFLFNSDNSGNIIPFQSNSDVLRNYTSGLASGQSNVTKPVDTIIPPFKILPKIPANFDFKKNITMLNRTMSTTTIKNIIPNVTTRITTTTTTTTTIKPTTMVSIAPVTRTSTKMTTTTKPTEKVLAVYSMNGYQNREQTIKESPKIDNINLLFPHHHHIHHQTGHKNYQVLEDDSSISNTESYVVNPVDATKLKEHPNGQAEIFTKSNSNSLSSGFGILKLAGCNIYGRMYRVGKIISELSGPCLECKCTDIGVNCTPLSC